MPNQPWDEGIDKSAFRGIEGILKQLEEMSIGILEREAKKSKSEREATAAKYDKKLKEWGLVGKPYLAAYGHVIKLLNL
jgi:hypothetical protein